MDLIIGVKKDLSGEVVDLNNVLNSHGLEKSYLGVV